MALHRTALNCLTFFVNIVGEGFLLELRLSIGILFRFFAKTSAVVRQRKIGRGVFLSKKGCIKAADQLIMQL